MSPSAEYSRNNSRMAIVLVAGSIAIWLLLRYNNSICGRCSYSYGDRINITCLIELSEVVCDIVAEIYNKSLCTGDISEEWRLANVTAVFKKGKSHLRQTIDLLV